MAPLSIYTTTLTLLLTFSLALFILQRRPKPNSKPSSTPPSQPSPPPNNPTIPPQPNDLSSPPFTAKASKTRPNIPAFLTAYTLSTTSDWLQGPYLYPLYRTTHSLSPSTISSLFITGFVSAAVSAAFVGGWADRHGRRRACLQFCWVYGAGCLLTSGVAGTWMEGMELGLGNWGRVGGLVLGRVLGGIGTSLMMCGFESWVVGAVGEGNEEDLGRVMGLMSGLNSAAAIVCGVGSEWVVERAGTNKAPFWLAAGVLGLAWGVIWWFWDENYGETAEVKDEKRDILRLRAVLLKPQVLALGVASTVFEGSMYLFVFFWTPALKSVQSSQGELPYGVIFSSFMAATLASSFAFNLITERQLVRHTTMLAAILGVSAACFFLSAQPRSEDSAFWVFCLFEAVVGMYWPCMGYLKGKLIDNGVRAQVYGMLRIPLNIFVVVSLLSTGDGGSFGKVFSLCSTLLLASSGALSLALGKQAGTS